MFRSSIFVTALAIGGSFLGFVVQLLLARQFGTGVDVEVYLFSISLPTFLAGMIAALLSYSLVPQLVAYETDLAYLQSYIYSLLLGVGCLSLCVFGFGALCAGIQKSWLPATSAILQHRDLDLLMTVGWAIAAAQILQGYLVSVLNAQRRHLWAALLGLGPYLGMLGLMLALGSLGRVVVISFGMFLGALAASILALISLRKQLQTVLGSPVLWSECIKQLRAAPMGALAMSCFSAYAVIDAYWAPKAGAGTLAALGYAQRMVIALGNLAVAGPSAVLVPQMAAFVRDGDFARFRRFFLRTVLIVGGMASVLAVGLIVFAEPLIRLLFSRGAFGESEVLHVAAVLRYMAPGMVFMLMSVIGFRAIFCIDSTGKYAGLIGITWCALYFALSAFFFGGGARALAACYSGGWGVVVVVVFLIILRVK